MKKNKLLSMMAAICMISLIGVGATTAYFSDTTEERVNIFTMGKVDIELEEPGWEEDKEDIVPGQSFAKDPTVTVVANSVPSYVFMNVEGIDEMEAVGFSIDSISTHWKKIDQEGVFKEDTKKDGIYVYVGDEIQPKIVESSTEDTVLEPLFQKVTYGVELTENSGGKFQIKVKAAAIQAEGGEDYTYTEAFKAMGDGILIQ